MRVMRQRTSILENALRVYLPALVTLIMLICLEHGGFVQAYRYAWRPDTKVFPYQEVPPPSLIDNGDNEGEPFADIVNRVRQRSVVQKCISLWRGDGKCNSDNNKADCEFDDGDCCAFACKKQCQEVSANGTDISAKTFAIKRKTERPCPFKCGVMGYNCLARDQGCVTCNLTNAECRSQELCYEDQDSHGVLEMLDSCQAFDWSMGNTRTINQYCGQDPLYQVVHDANDRRMHFPGCGVPQVQCTKRPCCTDALKFNLNSTTCSEEEKTYEFFDPVTYQNLNKTTTCRDHFRDCFKENARSKGQCCQCNKGWTGFDCNEAICYSNRMTHKQSGCFNGQCMSPDDCVCTAGWTGEQCNLGICTNCVNGFCEGPEDCVCFYGWGGANCSEAISFPSCLNGVAVAPDFCMCDAGWQGRACDVGYCQYGCGTGSCKDAFTCECEPGWYSTDVTSPCDAKICSELDPQCKECLTTTPFTCTKCEPSHFLSSTDQTCSRCDLNYPHCYECSDTQCLKCQYPFFVDLQTKKCVSYGIFETAQDLILVDETWAYFDVRIVRMHHGHLDAYTSTDKVLNDAASLTPSIIDDTVILLDYDLMPAYRGEFEQNDIRIARDQGTIEFLPTENEKIFRFKIFRRQYYEHNHEFCKFNFNMRFSQKGGQVRHAAKSTLIEYFDADPLTSEMNDAFYTQTLYQGVAVPSDDVPFTNVIGSTYTFTIRSYYKENGPKSTPHDVFLLRVILVEPGLGRKLQQVKMYKASRLSGNTYSLAYSLEVITAKELWLNSACRGIRAKYYGTREKLRTPLVDRIEPFLPSAFDYTMSRLTWFRADFEFVFAHAKSGGTRSVEFNLHLNSGATADVYINELLVISLPENEAVKHTVDCPGSSAQLSETSKFTGETTVTGCCATAAATYTYPSMAMDGSKFYFFRIEYKQANSQYDVRYKQDPCVIMTRSSTGLAKTSIDISETYALTNLKGSPYAVTPRLNQALIDFANVIVSLAAFTDPNSGVLVTGWSEKTLQAGVHHHFGLEFADVYGNKLSSDIVLNPPYDVMLLDGTGATLATNTSYFDHNLAQNMFWLYTTACTTAAGATPASLDVVLSGQRVGGAPFGGVKVLPGAYSLDTSPAIEHHVKSTYATNPDPLKQPRCYVGAVCSIEVTLKDAFGNLVNHDAGVLKAAHLTGLLVGPFENVDGYIANQTYVNAVAQHDLANLQLYYHDLPVYRVGLYKFYNRARKEPGGLLMHQLNYPAEFNTYSDIPSHTYCVVLPRALDFVGETAVKLQAKDRYNNTLTDSGVLFRSLLVKIGTTSSTAYEVWDDPARFTLVVAPAKYEMVLLPAQVGRFTLTVYVCELPENACTSISEYVLVDQPCPAGTAAGTICTSSEVYLTTKFPSPTLSTAAGSSLAAAVVNNYEFFGVQLSDKYGNAYDVATDQIHLLVPLEKYIKLTLESVILTDPANPSAGTYTKFTTVQLYSHVLAQGQYVFRYKLEYLAVSNQLSVQVLHSEPLYDQEEANGKTHAQLQQLDYVNLATYLDVPGSPFTIASSVAPYAQVLDYKEDLKLLGLAFDIPTIILDPVIAGGGATATVGTAFKVPIDTRNMFDLPVIMDPAEYVNTPLTQLIFVDLAEETMTCTVGSPSAKLTRYCSFFSYSHEACVSYTSCAWIPNELSETSTAFTHPDINSCQPCSNIVAPQDSALQGKIVVGSVAAGAQYYEVDVTVNQAGKYKFMAATMQQGSLRISLFTHTDYTQLLTLNRVVATSVLEGGGFNATLKPTFDAFLEPETMHYSAVIQGSVRFDHSTFYNLTFRTNLLLEFHFDGELLLTKTNQQDESLSLLDRYVEKGKLYDIEVYLRDVSLYQRKKVMIVKDSHLQHTSGDLSEERVYGYIELYESCPFQEARIIPPRNLFNVQHVKNNRIKEVTVDP